MKKLFALILSLTMVLSLAACGSSGSGDETTTTAEETTTTAASEETTTTAAETTEEDTEEQVTSDTGSSSSGESKVDWASVDGSSWGEIKIGHLLDITGTEAATGAQAQAAFNYAIEKLGAAYNIEFSVVEGDCQSDASAAATQALSMIDEGCVAIFGPTQIGHKSAVMSAIEDNGVPLILYNGTPSGAMASSSWAVGAGGSTAQFPTVMADYAYNELGLRTVVCFCQDTTGGTNYIQPFIDNFTAMGGTVLDGSGNAITSAENAIRITMGTTDWSSYAANMKTAIDAGAESIVGWTSSSDAIAFWKAWVDNGLSDTPVLATMHGGFSDFYIMKAISGADAKYGEAVLANPVYAPIMWCYSVDNEENQAFVEQYETDNGAVPGGNNLAGSTYQALELLIQALAETDGDTTASTLYDAIIAADYYGPEGHTFFEEGTNVAVKDTYVVKVVQLEDGSWNYEVMKTYAETPLEGLSVE